MNESTTIDNIQADRFVCRIGSYCEISSYDGTPCPVGTFSDSTGRSSVNDCQNCTAGYYCPELGMESGINSGYECAAGYFCETKAKVANPNFENDDFDGLCPIGYYCPEGTAEKQPCPVGTFGSIDGLESEQECTDCPGGYFCDREALTWDELSESDGLTFKENFRIYELLA